MPSPEKEGWRWLAGGLLIVGLVIVAASGWGLWQRGREALVTPTATPIAERLIPTALPSPTSTAPATLTASPSATATPVPPVATNEPTPAPTATATPVPPTATDEPTLTPTATVTVRPGLYAARERFGIGVGMPPPEAYPGFETLGMGWYLDWQTHLHPSRPGGIEYAQMVRLQGESFRPGEEELQAIARANPGSLWLVGNEPDVIWQDNATPEQYATVYHRVYHALKAADPTAQVAIAGVSQPTPLRLQYLDAILAAYRERYGAEMPVDVWNVHNFILREERGAWGVDIPPGMEVDTGVLYEVEDCGKIETFREQIYTFRRWMKDRGFREKPLIVSEYGIPMPADYGYPFERVRDFMYATFDFFLTATDPELGYPPDGDRLVQRWCWYSLGDTMYPTGNLFDPETREMTPLGRAWRGYFNQHEETY